MIVPVGRTDGTVGIVCTKRYDCDNRDPLSIERMTLLCNMITEMTHNLQTRVFFTNTDKQDGINNINKNSTK